jgi:hypothetical protein
VSRRERPERLAWLIQSKRIVEEPFDRVAVAQLWRKAIDSARDAELDGISLDGAIRAAYDGALAGAFAVLAAYQLRVGSGQGHHEAAFAAVAALELEGLEDLVADSSEIRALRRGSVYDPILATDAGRTKAVAWTHKVLPVFRGALIETDGSLRTLLPSYPR